MDNDKFNSLGKAYLQSNAYGMEDGSLKASTHRNLCNLFVSERLNVSVDEADALRVDGESIANSVRKATLSLTDNLDIEVGLPLDRAPNYKKLTPIFVGKFLSLASDWFDDQVGLMSDDLLKETAKEICRYTIDRTLPAFESYGFEFVDGVNKATGSFLTVKSKIGQVITIKPNKYFGCSFTLDATL